MKRKIRAIAIFIVLCMLSVYMPIEATDISATDSAEMITEEIDTSSYSENECEYETEVWSEEYIEPISSTDIVGNPGEAASTTSTPITSSIIPDGVYGLQNVGNAGLWMDIQHQRSDPGYHVQQYAQTSSSPPTDTFYRASLFKISNIPGTNQYVIRSMLNNRLSFGFSGTEVITKEIPPEDSDVPLADRFTITYSTNGYVIKPYGSTYAISANNTTASGSAGAPDSYLSKRTTTDAGDRAKWNLYQYTGTNRHGTFYTYPASWTGTGIVLDSSTTLKPKTWSTVIGANTPFLQVASGYEHIASYTWDAVNFEMTLDANAVGTVRTYTKILYDGTETVLYAGTSTFTVVPKAGRYYLRNEATKKYAGVASELMTIGTAVQQFDYDTSNRVQWIVEHVSDSGGYVKLKSNCTGLYMGINASNSTIVEQSVTSDYILWKFETTASGKVKAFCKATESSGAVLSVASSSNGANLTMSTYESNNEWVMWYIPYTFNLNHYYDEGYSVRFANEYGTAYQRITNYSNYITERLMHILGLGSIAQYSSFDSPADECKEMNFGDVNANNLQSNCQHTPIHLTRTQMRSALSNGTPTTTIVIWTGHILNDNPASDSNRDQHSILITPNQTTIAINGVYVNKSESEIVQESIYTLFHELSHQLGNPDHYCRENGGTGPCSNKYCDECVYKYDTPRECIMSRRYDVSTLSDEFVLCQECKTRIIEHLRDHH